MEGDRIDLVERSPPASMASSSTSMDRFVGEEVVGASLADGDAQWGLGLGSVGAMKKQGWATLSSCLMRRS